MDDDRCVKCRKLLNDDNRDKGAEFFDSKTQETVIEPPWPKACGLCASHMRARL